MEEDSWELTSTPDAITMVLVGKHGNGKSATGNSILGRKAFESRSGMSGVTSTCQLESTLLEDGRNVNVIDTPGMFEFKVGSDEIERERIKCLSLAKDGVDAVILVFSIRSRFSEGEETTLERLQMFFGETISHKMIIVFTGGDDLEEDDTFTDYLGQVPAPVQTIIQLCKNRVLLFNNKTKDKVEKNAQIQQLMSCVDSVRANNGRKLFSDEISRELKVVDESRGFLSGKSVFLVTVGIGLLAVLGFLVNGQYHHLSKGTARFLSSKKERKKKK